MVWMSSVSRIFFCLHLNCTRELSLSCTICFYTVGTVASLQEISGFHVGSWLKDFCVILSLCQMWLFSTFLPQFNDMHVRLVGDSESVVGVHVSLNGCLALCVSPVLSWRLVPACCPISAGTSSSHLPLDPRWIST